MIQKRDAYIAKMINKIKNCDRRIVYADESYIHRNYQQHEDSLCDPKKNKIWRQKDFTKVNVIVLLLRLLLLIVV